MAQRSLDTDPVYAGADTWYRFSGNMLEKSTDAKRTWNGVEIKCKECRDTELPFFLERKMQWLDKDNGYIWGDDGTYAYALYLFRTTDGGKTWTEFHADFIPQSSHIDEVKILDKTHHFIFIGYSANWSSEKDETKKGVFYVYSEDAGVSWKLMQVTPDDVSQFNVKSEVAFGDNGVGVMTVGSAMYKTADFGKTWNKL